MSCFWTNFGVVRNVETLKMEGPAPIFDNGNSLWYNQAYIPEYYDKSLTFRSKHEKQIGLVTSFQGLDWHKMQRVPSKAKELLARNKHIGTTRADTIALRFYSRIKSLERSCGD